VIKDKVKEEDEEPYEEEEYEEDDFDQDEEDNFKVIYSRTHIFSRKRQQTLPSS
jgi:hypothetical protein